MAVFTTFPGDRTQPAEYAYTQTVYCHTCGADYDEETHLDVEVDTFDGKFYCMHPGDHSKMSCLNEAKEASYRERAADIAKDAIAKALEEIHSLFREIGCSPESDNDPTDLLEDLRKRVEVYEKEV